MKHPKVLVLPMMLGRRMDSAPCLALGMITAYLKVWEDGRLLSNYSIEPIIPAGFDDYPMSAAYDQVRRSPNPVCLFSSYVWNHKLNLRIAERVKEMKPGSIIVFGGPHVPRFDGETEQFMRDHPFIDIAVLGEGEAAVAEVLAKFEGKPRQKLHMPKLTEVGGIVYTTSEGEVVRTGDRQRIKNIMQLPSPYLTGEFEPWFEGFSTAILETNRGCPYGCTYCDWGSATLSKVTKFTAERVIAEIEYIASRKSDSIFIADANFGMLEQDIEIATKMVEIHQRTGYPRRLFTNFAKNGGRRLMSVIKILHEGGLLPTGIIALQTTDEATLKAIARDNIKTSAYETMMTYFNEESIPMASDLMMGLPGQTAESFANDLQFCFDWKVSASGNYTSVMPNAPFSEKSYREEHQIEVDAQDLIVATSSSSEEDMLHMKKLYTMYLFNVRFGVLKYILYFLQIEHDVPAITFLDSLLRSVLSDGQKLPILSRVVTDIFEQGEKHASWTMLGWTENANFLFDRPESYYEEVFGYAETEFGVSLSEPEKQSLSQAQQAVMPRRNRVYPYRVALDHDVVKYVEQIKSAASIRKLGLEKKTLSQLPPGSITVVSEEDAVPHHHFVGVVAHEDQWELKSPLRFY